jgi:hypothetical protein
VSLHAFITGELTCLPEIRTSKSGKDFATTIVKVLNGANYEWIRLLAYGARTQEELLRLRIGDVLSAQGNLQIETYQAEGGETKVSLTCFAGSLFPLRQPVAKGKVNEGCV